LLHFEIKPGAKVLSFDEEKSIY